MSEEPRETPPTPPQPPAPLAPQEAPRYIQTRVPGLTWALILIALGVAFLLGNLGIINLSWWALAQYWPVALILLGLDLMVARRSAAGSLLVAGLSVAALIVVIWLASTRPVEGPGWFGLPIVRNEVSGEIEEPLGDAESLHVRIDLTVMDLEVGAQSGNDYAAQGEYSTGEGFEPQVTYDISGSEGELAIIQPNFPINFGGNFTSRMTLDLPRDVPIDLEVGDDVGRVDLDLSELNVRSLTVNTNTGAVTVLLPPEGALDEVSVHSDVGAVDVTAPDGASLDIVTLLAESNTGQVTVMLPAGGTLGEVNANSDTGAVTINVPGGADLTIGDLLVESNTGRLEVNLPASGSIGTLNVSADAGAVEVNIPGGPAGLSIGSITVENNSGSVDVSLPDTGDFRVEIDADNGAVTVHVPASLEARAEIDADLTRPDLSSRFDQVDDGVWETSGYGDSADRALIVIQVNTGSVTIAD